MADPTTPADRLLRLLGARLAGCPNIRFEFSIRWRPDTVQDRGRFTVWLDSPGIDIGSFAALLKQLGMPPVAQDDVLAPEAVRLGIGWADGMVRCYRHDRLPGTLKDRYRAWSWSDGGDLAERSYAFHFMPETPDGRRPIEFVGDALRPAFESLLAEPRLLQGSGFWVRTNRAGTPDQVDIALPWYPAAGSLPGVVTLARLLGVSADLPRWTGMPIRHVATSGGADATLYASAPRRGAWPDNEAALQASVKAESAVLSQALEDRFPAALSPIAVRSGAPDLDEFYGGDIATWRCVLGDAMHYHAGLFPAGETDLSDAGPSDAAPSDAAMHVALRKAVTELFPFIAPGSRIYDIGCGWGGPLAMLTHEHGCPSLGLTVSRVQFRYIAALGLPVRWGDAEQTVPPGHFDCALLLESLSHMQDKPRLLRLLRPFADRLVMRVNCQDAAPPGAGFGGSMRLVSSADLRAMLAATGWRVRHWQDRRREAIPSVAVWRRRLRSVPPTQDRHLETLRTWSERVAAMPDAWAANNPLIEVVAD